MENTFPVEWDNSGNLELTPKSLLTKRMVGVPNPRS